MNLKDYIESIVDYPKKGIIFRDITPLLQDGDAFKYTIEKLAEFAKARGATKIVGPEARGFMFGCPVAAKLGIGFVPIRKPGKLPRKTINESYDLEYGSNTLCCHDDALRKDDKVVIIDDLLATGGSASAMIELVKRSSAVPVAAIFYIELPDDLLVSQTKK